MTDETRAELREALRLAQSLVDILQGLVGTDAAESADAPTHEFQTPVFGFPKGIPTDIVNITPNDEEDNVPSDAIGFVITFNGMSGSENGAVDIITRGGSERTFPFTDSFPNYLLIKRIKATNFPLNAVAKAIVIQPNQDGGKE